MLEKEPEEPKSKCYSMRNCWKPIAGFEDGTKQWAKECRQSLEAPVKQVNWLSPTASKKNSALPTPWF